METRVSVSRFSPPESASSPPEIMGKDHLDIVAAVRADDAAALQKLLSRPRAKSGKMGLGSGKKLNVDWRDEDGLAPLHHAALGGNVRIIAPLIESGAAVDVGDDKGLRPLHYASWKGHADPVKLLLDAGAEVAPQSGQTKDTPLHLAAQHGHYDVVALLVHHRADPTVTNSASKNALDLACEFGRSRVVDLLLKSNLCDKIIRDQEHPNLDLLNKEKTTCLHLAAKNGHIDVIRLLLDAGMDINRQTMNGTCLHEAALCGKIDVVRLLLDYGVDANRPNSFDQTALDIVNKFTTSRAAKDMKQLLREASFAIQARAVQDYHNAFDPASLGFSKGELVTVLERNPDGHWKGFCSRDGQLTKTGFFPSAFVEIIGDRGEDRRDDRDSVEVTDEKSARDDRRLADQPAYLQRGVPSRPVAAAIGQPPQQQLQRQFVRAESRERTHPPSPDGQVKHHLSTNYAYGPQQLVNDSPVKDSGGSSRNSTVSVDSGRSSVFKNNLSARHGGGSSGVSSSSGASSGVGSLHNGSGGNCSGPLQPPGHRLSYESSASSSRHSYHSSSSSLGSLDKVLEESSSTVNVLDLFQKGWSDQEVLAAWLTDLRFEDYVNNFLQAGYDMPTITRMTPEDLTAIGVTKPAHRKKLKAEISQLNIGDGIPDYKPDELLEWLTLLRLEGYHESLLQQGYETVDDMLDLMWEDLEEIGVSRLGHQKKLMLAIKFLQNPSIKKRASSLERDKQSFGHYASPIHQLHVPQSSNRLSACSNSSSYSHDTLDSRGQYADDNVYAPPSEIVHLRQTSAQQELTQPDIVAIQVRNSGGSFRLSQLSGDSVSTSEQHQATHRTFCSPTRRTPSFDSDDHHYATMATIDRDSTPTTTEESHYSSIGEQHYASAQPRTLSPTGSTGSSGAGRGLAPGAKIAPIRPRPVAKIVARTKQSIHGEEGAYEASHVSEFATLPRNMKVGNDPGKYEFHGSASPIPPGSPSKSPGGKRQPPPPPKRMNSSLDGGAAKSALDADQSSKWAQGIAPDDAKYALIGAAIDDSTQENFASCVQSLATKFQAKPSFDQSSSKADEAPAAAVSAAAAAAANDSDEAYHSQASPSVGSDGGLRNPMLDSPGSVCSLDCEDFPPPPPPLALEEFALVDVRKGEPSSPRAPNHSVSVSRLTEKLDAKFSFQPRPELQRGAPPDIAAPPLRLQHSAPSPRSKPAEAHGPAVVTSAGAAPASPSRSNYVSFHFKENNKPTAPVVPQPHRSFSPQHKPDGGTAAPVSETMTILKPQVLSKPVVAKRPSPGRHTVSTETLDDSLAKSETSLSSGSPQSTLGRGESLPFANENIGTIKQRNHFPGSKPSVIPGSDAASPFQSPTPRVSSTPSVDPADPPRVKSGRSGTTTPVTAVSQAMAPSGRRGGAKSVAQIPLDASLSSTIRRHSGLYPSSDEEGSGGGLAPPSSAFRQFVATTASTTSVATTASGGSDSDGSGSVSSTGTVRRCHPSSSAVVAGEAKEKPADGESGDALSSSSSASPATRSKSGIVERFKQPPPPPPPSKPDRKGKDVAPERVGNPATADKLAAMAGKVGTAPTAGFDIVESTDVLNDIGNMLAGLTEELDAMLEPDSEQADDPVAEDEANRETVIA